MNYNEVKDIRKLVRGAAVEIGGKSAFREIKDGSPFDITYKDFEDRCEAVGKWVAEESEKLGHSARVVMMSPNNCLYVTMILGVMYGGGVAIPTDPQMEEPVLCACLNKAEADILICHSDIEVNKEKIKEECSSITKIIDMAECENILKNYENSNKELREIDKDDCAAIIFTSGTTGEQKGVMLSHNNLVDGAFSTNHDKDYIKLNVLPLHHLFCLNADIILNFTTEAVTCFNGDVSNIGENMQLFQPTLINMVPRIAQAIYSKVLLVSQQTGKTPRELRDAIYGKGLKRLITGGAHLPSEMIDEYADMGITIRQGYGMSEYSPTIASPDMEREDKAYSAGRVVIGCETRNVDGELQVKGPAMMLGYVNDPELTAEVITEDGWLRTGDIGYVDEDNFLYITGRIKNLIILANGENVSPEQIENALLDYQIVEECLVYGEDNTIVAEIYPNETYTKLHNINNVPAVVDAVVEKINRGMPTHKQILKHLIRKNPFARTSLNKIIRTQRATKEDLLIADEAEFRMPETEIQQIIYDCFAQALGHTDFGIDTDIISAGLDSMGGMQLMAALEDLLDFTVELNDLLDNNTVELLAALYEQQGAGKENTEETAQLYPLTLAQRVWVYQRRGGTLSSIPTLFRLAENIDIDTVKNVLVKLCEIHPVLKNVLIETENGFMNYRDDSRPVNISVLDLTKEEWEERQKDLVHLFTFDNQEPLYRFNIYKVEGELYLHMVFSHVVADGTSVNMLIKDLFMMLYGMEVKPEEYNFYDYVQENYENLQEYDNEYWVKRLEGAKFDKSCLANPGMPDMSTAEFDVLKGTFDIDREKVLEFGKENNVTEAALFNTAFCFCQSLYGDMDDTCMHSTYNGRVNSRMQKLIGEFASTYLFRCKFDNNMSVEELLRNSVRQQMETLSQGEKVALSVTPTEMMFQYQGQLYEIPEEAEKIVKAIHIQQQKNTFHLIAMGGKAGYTYEFRYCKTRFETKQMELFIKAMSDVVNALIKVNLVEDIYGELSKELFPETEEYTVDRFGRKQLTGGWGKLCKNNEVSNQIVKVRPDGSIDKFENCGNIVKSVFPDAPFVDLDEIKEKICSCDGVKDAYVYIKNNKDNKCILAADISAEETDVEELKACLNNSSESYKVPAEFNIKAK